MKTKICLFFVLTFAVTTACNQSEKSKEIKSGTKTEEVQKVEDIEARISKGLVLNESNNEPIIMAMVIVAGTSTGTITGPDGKFIIEAPVGAKKLFISADGYESVKIDIDDEKEITVKLKQKTE